MSRYGQLCWHNEDLIQYLISQARAMLTAARSQPGPPVKFFSVTQNDNVLMCQDPEELGANTPQNESHDFSRYHNNADCTQTGRLPVAMLFTETIEIDPRTAIVEENGGAVVAPMLRATNRIATALADEFPTVLFDTFAYTNTLQPPTKIKPADNVVVRICTAECNFAAPLTDPVNALLYGAIEDWAKISKQLTVWDCKWERPVPS